MTENLPVSTLMQRASAPRWAGADAGRALEKLGHAIEYLSDEYVNEDSLGEVAGSRLQAIELLMSLNRSVYLECA